MKKITLTLLSSLLALFVANSQSTANYSISLTTTWNTTDHTSVPGSAHWSPLVGATHNTANEFFELGVVSPMTDGIKDVAETGSATNFNAEVNTAIAANRADQYFNTSGLGNAIGTFTLNNIDVSEDFSLITLVSMVAPSPDWFIGVNSVDLRSGNNSVNNGWKDTFSMDVFTYDAGTDDGTDYSSSNMPSNPRVGVSMVNGAPINGNKMGTITFTYNSSTLSNSNSDPIETITMLPNPTRGNITISNIKHAQLQEIEIYSVLGNLVKEIPVKTQLSQISLNLSHLKQGIYIVNLKGLNGKNKTKRLIIR